MLSFLQKHFTKFLCLTGAFLILQLLTVKLYAQTDTVYWDFGTASAPTPYASYSSNINVLTTACLADTGNVNSTGFGSSVYSPIYLTDQYSSTNSGFGPYSGASGEPTLRNNAKTGGFNATSSTYFSFSVAPNTGYQLTIKSISFGGLRYPTGPTQYAIRTSADGYATNIGSGTLTSNTYGGVKKSLTGLNIAGTAGTPVIVRIYTYNPISSATGGNVFLDDATITYTVTLAGCSGTPSHATASATPASFCSSGSSSLFLTGSSSGLGIGYQWFQSSTGLPGSFSLISSATASTYSTPTLNNTTYYYCVTTCSNSSLTDTSDIATVTVTSSVTPSVSISSSAPSNTICTGTAVTFTATPANGGSIPSYQWKKNGSNVGTNSTTYTNNSLVNGDIITCVMISNAACASPATATSNAIAMVVNTPVTPSVTITSNAPSNTTCAGATVTFTAAPVNGGTTPSYQWKRNGSNVSTNGAIYTNNALVNGDIITCVMTSNAACASPTTATSNAITMTVNANFTPSVSISSNAPSNAICAGTSVTFTAAGVNSPSNITLTGSTLTCTLPTTATTSCVNGFFASGWTTGTQYWQYQVSTLGYQNIVFSTPTSSSATGPHNGSAYYSTDGVNFNFLTNYSFSGTGCTSTGNISLPAAADNKSAVYIRLIMTGATNVGGTNRVSSGNTFKGNLLPAATPSYQWKKNASNVGTNSTTYTDNSLANSDVITCLMTSNAACASLPTATSNSITMTVNPVVTPSVTINSSASSNTTCAGTPVTFTATPVNGGSTPVYQWKKNGSNVGINSATYTDNGLVNGDAITCEMTSNAACAMPLIVTGNTLNMTVNPVVTASVSINPQFTTTCQGTATTFTAVPVNGGSAPLYQWKVNGNNVATGLVYTNPGTLNNNDAVSVEMTSNATCASPATVNASVGMTILPVVVPTVSISFNPGNNICAGTAVNFTANATGGGSAPTYQWYQNGVNVGSGATFNAGTGLVNGDVIKVVLKSNVACPMGGIDTAYDTTTMTVNPILTPVVSISSNTGASTCAGTAVAFTANATNGGSSPAYQWQLNSVNVGTNSSTYTNSVLPTGNNVVTCTVTSSYACYSTPTATDTYNITVNPLVTPTITIGSVDAPGGAVCSGSNVTFTANTTNAGSGPSFQWKLNGTNVGTNSSSYNAGTTLATGDVVTCVLTSNVPCAAPSATAVSNAVNITVYPVMPVSVAITSVIPANQACTGYPDTFKAIVVNGGSNPVYQWKKDGNPIGLNKPTYIDSSWTGGIITCEVTSSIPCATPVPAVSNPITLVANPIIPVMIKIYASPDSIGCDGEGIDFFSYFSNGGQTPQYKWYVNGKFIPGAVQPWFQSKLLNDGDVVTCEFFSSMTCAFSLFSNPVKMHMKPSPVPHVTIKGMPNGNNSITFVTDTLINGGTSPKYQWRKNTVDIPGATNPTYTLSPYQPTDKISLFLQSSEECANPTFLLSNTLDVSVVTDIGHIASGMGDLQLLPNPNSGKFTVKGIFSKGGNRQGTIEILNGIGQTVFKNTANISGTNIDLPVDISGGIVPGVYLMRLRIDDETSVIRFELQ